MMNMNCRGVVICERKGGQTGSLCGRYDLGGSKGAVRLGGVDMKIYDAVFHGKILSSDNLIQTNHREKNHICQKIWKPVEHVVK